MTDDSIEWPPGADPDLFFANLAALAGRSPMLAERLCWPVDGSHVRADVGGAVLYSLHGTEFPLAIDGVEAGLRVDAALARASGKRLLVFGVGLGELVTGALERGASVTAWDRDPWLLRLALGRRDWGRELESGELRLALGTDLLELAHGDVVAHPFLEEVYARERALFEASSRGGDARPRALLCSGGLCVDSLGAALAARGYGVWTCDAERSSREELEHTARALRPELVASINYRDGLADFARAIDAELLVWEIDPATSPIRNSEASAASERTRIFSYRRENVHAFRAAGFRHAEYLPLAADVELRYPLELTAAERAHYAASVSFVGSSMAASTPEFVELFLGSYARWRGSPAARNPGREILEEITALQRADFAHFAARELLEERAPGFARWCVATGERCDPVALLGELSASEKRLAWLSNLGSRLAVPPSGRHGANDGVDPRLQVWGDAGWERIAHHGVRYRGPASHARDLTRIYCASAINLDLGRLYQADIATLRTFDVLACGGFALVEHNAALAELFELGVELVTYRDFAELWEKLSYYLAHPDEARAIAERGRAAVLARHTFDARVDHMLRSLERDTALAGVR